MHHFNLLYTLLQRYMMILSLFLHLHSHPYFSHAYQPFFPFSTFHLTLTLTFLPLPPFLHLIPFLFILLLLRPHKAPIPSVPIITPSRSLRFLVLIFTSPISGSLSQLFYLLVFLISQHHILLLLILFYIIIFPTLPVFFLSHASAFFFLMLIHLFFHPRPPR